MGCKQSRKKKNPNNTKHLKTKKRTRDIDQVHDDLKNPERFMNLPTDEDLPGEGQNYCISCARHFQTAAAMAAHSETKTHKRRLKMALEDPHTQVHFGPSLCSQHAQVTDHNVVSWEGRIQPRAMEISGVRLGWTPGAPESVKIAVSPDGRNFHDATNWLPAGEGQQHNVVFASPEMGKAVKVLMKDSRPMGSFGISEFALVGKDFL